MAISVDWDTKIISVPRVDMTLVQSSPEIRQLDTNQFRLDLRGLEDDEDGIAFLPTHDHKSQTLLGGIIYARIVEIINGYTITIEDGQYAVKLTGSNNNIEDVLNVNQVSLRSANSAGLTNPAADQLWNSLRSDYRVIGSFGEGMGNALGLMQHNFFLENSVYNSNGLLTAGTIRLFPTKALTDVATDGGSNEGEIATYSIVAIAESGNATQIKEYRVTQLP